MTEVNTSPPVLPLNNRTLLVSHPWEGVLFVAVKSAC